MNYIKTFIIPSFILLLLDIMYIYINKKYIMNQIISVQKRNIQPRFVGIFICYFIICVGFCHFIIEKKENLINSFFMGVFVYGTYTMTNYVSFEGWKIKTVAMDTIWGGVLFAATNYLSRQITG